MGGSVEHQVAVVGMSCRYPGAPSLEAFWELITLGREGLTRLDEARLRGARVPSRMIAHPDYVPVTGLLSDPMKVDPEALGLSETEAVLLDPQQRMFLECSVEALESAGLGREGHRGVVGVYAGQSLPTYLIDNLGDRFNPRGGSDPIGSLHLHGLNVGDYLPGRTAWQLGLTGPTVAVGATCATSLVSIHLAVAALLAEECDTALAGGVSLRLPQEQGYLSVPDGPFSRDGRTCAYGRDASGTVFTQGAGVVALRRLGDAMRDGDPIHAVVLGTAIGNDGPDRAGFSAPSVSGQARVIAEALAVADVTPQQIGLVEGHGTGTQLGDPIEVRALNEVFGTAASPWCWLGSVKSMIGHTDSAAGVAGFIKAVLSVENGVIPPTLHADVPHEALPLTGSAFSISTKTRPWGSSARMAGISAFGIGGSTAHAVIGSAPAASNAVSGPVSSAPLLISAASRDGLEQRTSDLQDLAAGTGDDLAGVLAHGARHLSWRRAQVAGELTAPVKASSTSPRLVAVFPGGGAQYAGMGVGFHALAPTFAASLDASAELIRRFGGIDPRRYVLDPHATGGEDPRIGLPALAAVELAVADLLEEYGLVADLTLGHSLGEYVAAVVAGAMTRADALQLVVARAALLADLPVGAMLSVALPVDDIERLLTEHPELDLAVVNGERLGVVAGPEHAITKLQELLQRDSVEHRRLRVGVAAHSRLVDPVMGQLGRLSSGFTRPSPERSLVSCLDGKRIDGPLTPDHWVRHLRSTVRFDLAMATAQQGVERTVLLQLGPGGNLVAGSSHSETCWPDRDQAGDVEYARAALHRVLAYAWSHGFQIDLERLAPRRRTVRLPAYPWQRRSLGLPPRIPADGALGVAPSTSAAPSFEQPLQRPVWRQDPRVAETEKCDGIRISLSGDVPADLRVALKDRGLLLEEKASILIHVSAPDDLVQLHSEVERFAQLARSLPEGQVRGLLHLTLGAEDVIGTEPISPFATATTGLARVLGQEVAGLDWVTVDLDPREPAWGLVADEVARLHARMSTTEEVKPAAQPHRALRGRRSWERRWEAWQPQRPQAKMAPAVWVITGGLGSVGLALATRIEAERPQDRVVLAGRSLPEPGQPRYETVAALSRTEVERVDVAEPGALTRLLALVRKRHGRLDAVVHAPTQVDLAPLAELDQVSVDAAFAPKVSGALELAAAVSALSYPPRVLLLSSAAGTIGGFGLGAYVAAGRFLDGFAVAHEWATLDLERIRLGTAAEARSAAEVSMRHAIDLADAVTAILRVVELDVHGYLAASPTELNTRTARLDTVRVLQERSDTSELSALSGWQCIVAEVWGNTLGRQFRSVEDDFFAFGGHSLLATRVLATFRNEHGVDLRLKDLLSASTVGDCAELLQARAAALDGPTHSELQVLDAPAVDEQRFGLTRIQHAYWIGRSRGLDPASPEGAGVGCHFYLEYEATGLDVPRYQKAWRAVVERHPMLRAVITEQGENRIINLPDDWLPPVIDLTRESADAAGKRLEQLRESWSTRVADPTRWPLIQPLIVQLGQGISRVLLSVDVLVCDSASWMLVDREVRARYLDPEVDLGPAPPPFAACVAALEARAVGPRREAARAYWFDRLATLPDAPAITSRSNRNARPHFTRLAARVSAETWGKLCEVSRQHRVAPTALVLAHYREVLAAWSGQDRFTVTVTVFDRPDLPRVETVVGEFSTMMLHEVEPVGAAADAWLSSRRTQERLLDDLDHREFTGLEVLAELSRRRGRTMNVPVVFTSMLGLDQLGDGNSPHDHEWLGPQKYGVSQTPQVWLDHQAFEHRGDLILQWDVCDSVIDIQTARRQFDRYVSSFNTTTPVRPAQDTVTEPAAATEKPTALRQQLELVWAELLGLEVDEIGDATFLALGGDSLLAVRMAAELRRQVGVGLPLNQIRSDLTISELLDLIVDNSVESMPLQLRRRVDPEAGFPLLPLQQGYFVGQSGGWEMSYDTAHVSTDVALTLPDETPDPIVLEQLLQRAADAVAAHQPMVRAQILADGSQRFRAVDDPDGRTPVRVIDLRQCPNPDSELDRLRANWAANGPNPLTGPGVSVDVVLLGGRRARMHVSSSLLLMDGWSASLYDRELFAQLREPDSLAAPIDLDFGDYVTTVSSAAVEEERAAHQRWWWQRIDDLPSAPRLPRRRGEEKAAQSMSMREFRLDPDAWQRLRGICQQQGITPSTVLLGAFALALRQLTGQQRLLLNSMQHNRIPIHPDVDRLIGAFSRTALLPLSLPDGKLVDVFHSIAEQLDELGRHHLVTAIEVGREVGRRTGRSHSIAPVVFQSTLGMDAALGGQLDDRVGPFGRISIGDYHQDLRTPQVELELRCFELDGELIASMASVDEVLAEGVPAELLHLVHDRVLTLLDPAAWVVSLPELAAFEHDDEWFGGTETVVRETTGPEEVDDGQVAAAAAIWCDLLNLGDVPAADEDFFSLGGDSLLAVRMLAQVRAELGISVSPREFLRQPNLMRLCRTAEVPAGTTYESVHRTAGRLDDALVELRSGVGRPIFLLHPSGGDILCYVELARLFDTSRPVIGISDPGLDGHAMPTTVGGMVDLYQCLIMARQPEGPWTLGGWSMGGTMAQELARRILLKGGEVDALVMIDSNSPARIIRLSGLDAADTEDKQRLRQLRSIEAFLGLDLGPHDDWRELAEVLVGEGALGGLEVLEQRFPVFNRHMEALAVHEAGHLDSTVPTLLLRASLRSPRNSGEGMGVDDIEDADLGWGPWIHGSLRTCELEAHHYSILQAPAVAQVAREVSDFLRDFAASSRQG
ncbi:MAG: SDR family NAD(P)-dependent oxidoreductase [Propionibacteriaceae bacterium]|nr:SDR family NAD(P)-dependent oxidoreductase [Propionibacteriaceae bacterium]